MVKSQNVVSVGIFFSGAGGILSTKALRDNKPSVRVLIPDQNKKRYLMASFLVELEGFEPSSKRGTNELSTCLAFTWFS